MDYQKVAGICSTILNNVGNMNRYLMNPTNLLIDLGVSDQAEQTAINELLIPVADFRQLQIKSFKKRVDYEKKTECLFTLIHDNNAARLFEESPVNYLNSAGLFIPEDQEQIINLLSPVKEFQKLLVKHREEKSNYQKKMQCLIRLVHNEEDKLSYKKNPQKYLTSLGILNKEDQEMIYHLLSPAEEFSRSILKEAVENLAEIKNVNTSYRQGLSKANYQSIKGFNSTMIMYQVSFYLGVLSIIAAIVFAFIIKSSLFTIVFGSIGTLDLLTFFIAKPPLRLEQSRSQQAKLNAAFYSWFLDLYNWNSYYLQFSNNGENVDLKTMKEVSKAQIENTEKLMQLISNNINI